MNVEAFLVSLCGNSLIQSLQILGNVGKTWLAKRGKNTWGIREKKRKPHFPSPFLGSFFFQQVLLPRLTMGAFSSISFFSNICVCPFCFFTVYVLLTSCIFTTSCCFLSTICILTIISCAFSPLSAITVLPAVSPDLQFLHCMRYSRFLNYPGFFQNLWFSFCILSLTTQSVTLETKATEPDFRSDVFSSMF